MHLRKAGVLLILGILIKVIDKFLIQDLLFIIKVGLKNKDTAFTPCLFNIIPIPVACFLILLLLAVKK